MSDETIFENVALAWAVKNGGRISSGLQLPNHMNTPEHAEEIRTAQDFVIQKLHQDQCPFCGKGR